MIQLAGVGPKLFLSQTELLKNEFVLWQEHNRLLVSGEKAVTSFQSLYYEFDWDQESPTCISAKFAGDRVLEGRWRVTVNDNRVNMTFAVTNLSDAPWPVAEVFMCYKHRGAIAFWNPELDRTFLEWDGSPVSVLDRIHDLHGPAAFWAKNHFHLSQFSHTFDRYARVGLVGSSDAGWMAHRDGASANWMAVQSVDGCWLSGIFWEGTERLVQNGPDYSCIHAGLHVGYDIEPGETVERKGSIVIDTMSTEEFAALCTQ